MSLNAGTQLGVYEITGQIGAGGMGEVYRATDSKLSRDVAIKTLPAALASDEVRLARFEREAKLLAALNHPHIASIYSLDEHEGTLYLAMELIKGETLEEKLKPGAMPVEDTLRLALQIAEALEAAHDKGVVHRDLKPANVMVTADGIVKVLDFGLAKAFSEDPNGSNLAQSPALSVAMTQQGLVLGTAGYMSPEQAGGEPTDQRTDIWAFGVVLYEMLTGLPLFRGETVPRILADVLKTEPDWQNLPPKLHPRLILLLKRCLRKDLRSRYHSIADVRVDIEAVLSDPDDSVVAVESSDGTDVGWRAILPVTVAALLFGAVIAGGTVWTLFSSMPEPVSPVSRYVITPPAETTLASLNGVEFALSDDGRKLAYIAFDGDEDGSPTSRIFLRELSSLDARALPGTELASNLFFSYDGQSIGFTVPGDGIKRVSIDSGQVVEILDGYIAYGSDWATDDTIIFAGNSEANLSDGLYRVSTTGAGTPVRITTELDDANAGSLFLAPDLLPGERAVLFSLAGAGGMEVWILDMESGEQRKVLDNARDARYLDSGHLVFTRNGLLMAVAFDPDLLQVLDEERAVLPRVRYPGGNSAADFIVSRNGTLAYVPPDESVELGVGRTPIWISADGETVTPVLDMPVNSARSPRLSPDGTRLLLTTGPVNGGELWIYYLDGRPAIPIADTGNSPLGVWSPDSSRIAFASNRDGDSRLYVVQTDGSTRVPEPLTEQPLTAGPATWSLNDEIVLTYFDNVTDDIYVVGIDSPSQPEPVEASNYDEIDAALSPDGQWLAYASNRTGQFEIWIKRFPDGVPVRVSNNGGLEPRWAAGGSELYFLLDQTIMMVAVQTEPEFSFEPAAEFYRVGTGTFGSPSPVIHSYDVAEDGRLLLIQGAGIALDQEQSIGIIVVENWFEELVELVPTP